MLVVEEEDHAELANHVDYSIKYKRRCNLVPIFVKLVFNDDTTNVVFSFFILTNPSMVDASLGLIARYFCT